MDQKILINKQPKQISNKKDKTCQMRENQNLSGGSSLGGSRLGGSRFARSARSARWDQFTVENSFWFSQQFYDVMEKYFIPDFLKNEKKMKKHFKMSLIM